MKTFSTNNNYHFLQGGGEMGELTRNYDWSKTSLGTPDQWPKSLHTLVNMMLNSRFPMLIFWGPDLITFYNDAFRPSLGSSGKHPSSLGQKGEQSWAESWPVIGPMIYSIMAGGEAVWFEDQKLPLYRDGRLDYAYWTYSFSPLIDDTGAVNGVLVTCSETTRTVLARQQAEETQQLVLAFFEQSPVGIAMLSARDLTFLMANPFYGYLVGRTPDQLVGKPLLVAMPELAGQGFDDLLKQVVTTGMPYVAREVAVDIVRNNQLETIYVDLTYQPHREANKTISAILVVATDVTQQVLSRQKIKESENRFRTLIEEAPVATCLFVGREMRVAVANELMLSFWGKDKSVLGKPLAEAVPELNGQPFLTILDEVFTTGQTYTAKNAPAELLVDGVLGTYYFDFTYKPLRDAAGVVYAIMDMAVDVTQQVIAQQQLVASEARLRSVIATAPAGMGLFVGRDLIVELPNQTFIDIVGKGPDIAGKPLREVMPELLTENQPFLKILDDVYTTGQMFQSYGSRVDIVQHGVMTHNYYNITYTPLRDEQGQVFAILDIAIDVTEEIKGRQKLQQAEEALRGAMELADIGTWELDVPTGLITYSENLKQLFEFTEDSLPAVLMNEVIHESDQDRIRLALEQVFTFGSGGLLDQEYTIVTRRTGRHRIVRVQARMYFDDYQQPAKLVGTMRDITEERQQQLALEQLVQQRTEELAAAIEALESTNQILASKNEEYVVINEELEEANRQLNRSNDNLQQFAYVASHDLQEPLRKIQSFGNLLQNQYADQLGEGGAYLERMQSAASRMSTLIRDLLSYSRISVQQDRRQLVSLPTVVQTVLTDLELVIAETGAEVTVGELPEVLGDPLQLGQLFQNLLTNALKFSRIARPGATNESKPPVPVIRVDARTLLARDVPALVVSNRSAPVYHQIDVIDNGIGFEQKYADRIFQVFQRLHGRNEYAGTGIGLAICEKVVTNHGGAIRASSQPGRGATFSVYLPG
ncbi:PAS domain-containing protein [Spirosoma linguale]